jgi:opacity protein-like surface antigen
MHRHVATVGLVLVLIALSPAAWAQQASDSALAVGGRVWVSSGYSTNSTDPSQLRWRGVDSVVTEGNVEFVWRRLVVMGSLGGGRITDGVLIDEDFSDAEHRHRFAVTRSGVDDTGLVYVNGDVGWRLLAWGPREQPGFVDGLLGYQFWFERYVAFGVTGTSTSPTVATSVSPSIKVITQEYQWHSLRVGGRTQVPLFAGLSLKARGFVLPWSKSIVEDVHHLRTDLRKDPSFRDEADGGLGVQVDAGLSYRIRGGLSVEAGYQYWRVQSGEGTSTARSTSGDVATRLLENRTERQGPYVGVQYRF